MGVVFATKILAFAGDALPTITAAAKLFPYAPAGAMTFATFAIKTFVTQNRGQGTHECGARAIDYTPFARHAINFLSAFLVSHCYKM